MIKLISYFIFKTLLVIPFIVMVVYPDVETLSNLSEGGLKSHDCLKTLKDVNGYLFSVYGCKWLLSGYRLAIYYIRNKETSSQVRRMRNEITRNIHGE